MEHCKKCLDTKYCSECFNNLVLNQDNNKCQCLDQYYLIISENQPYCISCQNFTADNCELCDSQGQCKKCVKNYYLSAQKVCILNCQFSSQGYYNNMDSQNCEKCPSGCELCFNNSMSECINKTNLSCSLTEIVNPYKFLLEFEFSNEQNLLDINYQKKLE
eukprot:TRINITY_DN5725_c0_g1_i2.p5 TRINITY_DN5725_c0_g1~~TRINITY_DN5725_c0_g1_i2.p5  ORF type:complete len:161 (+),score=31.16 TRINITY_DN5725_c0_g1_i2:1376-1858(+)